MVSVTIEREGEHYLVQASDAGRIVEEHSIVALDEAGAMALDMAERLLSSTPELGANVPANALYQGLRGKWRETPCAADAMSEARSVSAAVSASVPAWTREELVYQLVLAAELEHGLACVYMFAAFSLKDSEPKQAILGVAIDGRNTPARRYTGCD